MITIIIIYIYYKLNNILFQHFFYHFNNFFIFIKFIDINILRLVHNYIVLNPITNDFI